MDNFTDFFWWAAQILTSPWHFFAVSGCGVFLVVVAVVRCAKKRVVKSEFDRFLRTITLSAELLALVGTAGVAGYVGKTMQQGYYAQDSLEIEKSTKAVLEISTELFKSSACLYRKHPSDTSLSYGLSEVCAIARAGMNSLLPNFDPELWAKRIDWEKARPSRPEILTLLNQLKIAMDSSEPRKSAIYWYENMQRVKAAKPDLIYLALTLVSVLCSISLKTGKAWSERFFQPASRKPQPIDRTVS